MTEEAAGSPELHRETIANLPWFVIGRLDHPGTMRVAAHLEECSQCRAEFAVQRDLQAAIAARSPGERTSEPAFSRLMVQLDAFDGSPAPGRSLHRDRRLTSWTLAVGLAATVLVGVWVMVSHYAAPRFITATSVAPPPNLTHRLRLVVAPGLSLRAFESLLRNRNLRIVDGPTPEHAWTVVAPAGVTGAALQRLTADLRADPRVLLLEPVPGSLTP